jgi:hypothetical protein
MAAISEPFDEINTKRLIRVTRRQTDDLPSYVKDQVVWQPDDFVPGYYLVDQAFNHIQPIEFLENHWYYLFIHNDVNYTSANDRIEPGTRGTGY